jgi:DNA-binding transcriptional regulator LsrR (DeoR family)
LFAPRHPRKAFVVPLVGESASSYRRSFSQINRTVLQISQACDGIPYFLLAPLLVDTPELCQLLRADATIAPVVEKWDKLDHACIGIGTCPPIEDEVVYIGEDNVKKYKALGAIGDTCTRYFDAQGNYIKTDIHDRTIGVTIDQLFKARNLYIVGAGAGKTDAICAFIEKKKSVNLFIDEELATQMVRKIGGTSK